MMMMKILDFPDHVHPSCMDTPTSVLDKTSLYCLSVPHHFTILTLFYDQSLHAVAVIQFKYFALCSRQENENFFSITFQKFQHAHKAQEKYVE